MRLWRISRYPALDGEGGIIASNRWHNAPRRIVYCADHPSTALLEVLVHLEVDFDDLPNDYRLLKIDVPDHSSVRTANEVDLEANWQNSLEFSRSIGNSWFDGNRHLRLCVPSAVLPAARLHLLNAIHPEIADVQIMDISPVSFDRRLWKSN